MESSEPVEANMGIALLKQCNFYRANKHEKLPQRGRVASLVPKRPEFQSVYYSEHM